MNKVAVIGAGGMAGHMVSQYLSETEGFAVLRLYRRAPEKAGEASFDAENPGEILRIAADFRPDVIINCAGVLVKGSTQNPARAEKVNAELPKYLEQAFAASPVRIIHLSTDCVFSGHDGRYTETSPRDGNTPYAKSKAAGELDNNKDLTIRTSIIGPELKVNGTGLLHWFLTSKGDIKGFSQVFWTGVTTLELAKKLPQIMASGATGIVHFVPPSKISKYDLLRLADKTWNLNRSITEDSVYHSDKSLVSTRTDWRIIPADYPVMLAELKGWMDSHKTLYAQYYK